MVEEAVEPLTFADALNSKYADYEPKLFDNIQLSPKRRAALINKQGHHQRQILALDGCKVGSAGEAGEISEICPNLVELDLTKNFIQCWEQVFKIICQLPKLKFLNLSSNPFHFYFDEERIRSITQNNPVPKLKNLVLNNTKLPFEIIFKILSFFPEIEELHLSLNSYGHVVEWPSTFPKVTKLHFNSNDLDDWQDVMRIGKIFPSLRTLILCENFIKEVELEDDSRFFPQLETLSLSKTEINGWESLDEICKFPVLTDLRLVGVPLGKDEEEAKKRQLFISRLPNIKKLNGSKIDENEREDAERVFIRYYMNSDNPPERYHELVKMHGQLDRLAEVDLSRKDYVQVKLFKEDQELTKLLVDLSMNVRDFKRIICRKVDLKPKEFRMFFISCGQPVEMNQSRQWLSNYRMRDGDEILVQELQKVRM